MKQLNNSNFFPGKGKMHKKAGKEKIEKNR